MRIGDRVMVLPTRVAEKRVRPVNDARSPVVKLPAKATLITTEIPCNQEATLQAVEDVTLLPGAFLTDELEVEFDNGGQLFVHLDEIRPLGAVELIAELA